MIPIPDSNYFANKMKSLAKSLSAKQIDSLKKELKDENYLDTLNNFIFGAETYGQYGTATQLERRDIAKRYGESKDKGYLTIQAYAYNEIMRNISIALESQEFYSEEDQIVNQSNNHKLSNLSAIIFNELYKYFQNPTWPFDDEPPS